MLRLLSLSGLLVVLATISGCANYSSSHEYYKERPAAKLEVPPGLDRPIEKMDMAVPDASRATTYSSFRGDCATPAETSELQLTQLENLQVKRDGGFIWLQAGAAPQQLWPEVKRFFADNGYTLARADDELGIIETDWLPSQQGEMAVKSQYRLRFEFGATPASSELYLSLRQQSRVDGEWQRMATDPELEVEMLKRLANYLGDSNVEISEPESATASATEVVLTDQGKSGGISISINHDFEEAWRLTIRAIEQGGDSVEERSINQRFLLARFADHSSAGKARNASWMGSIIAPTDKHDVGRFRIEFFDNGSGVTTLQIQNLQGKPTGSERAKRIMGELEQALAEQ